MNKFDVYSKTLIVILLSVFFVPVYACKVPVEKFCVEYYKNSTLKGKPTVSRKAPVIKYNWGNHRPARRIPKNNFSARWRGRFYFLDTEYSFRVAADEGVRLMLDGQTIIDHWQGGVGKAYSVIFKPGAGKHLVEVEYFDSKGSAYLNVEWEPEPLKTQLLTVDTPLDQSINSTVSIVGKKSFVTKRSKAKSKIFLKPNRPGITAISKQAPIGINLSSFNYWSASIPFKDLLMQSGGLKVINKRTHKPCSKQPPLDTGGYPRFLPRRCLVRIRSVFHIGSDELWPSNTALYQPGRYVLLYQGRGKIKLSWDAKNIVNKSAGRIEFNVPTPKNGIEIQITAIDVNNPIRDMHIVHINDESSYKTQPFNEKWLNLLKPFDVIRFLDWGKVSENKLVYSGEAVSHTRQSILLPFSAPAEDDVFNDMVVMLNIDDKWPRILIDRYEGQTRTLYLKTPIEISANGKQPTITIYDFLNRKWGDRALATTLGQSSAKGVAFETMIKLANTLNVNPWINIPTAADDNFVEELALLLKNTLNPNLKCYIEYSNETWNFSYPGYHYSEAKARELHLAGTTIMADAWHDYRAVEIFKIFNRIYEENDLRQSRQQSRIVRVLTSQTAWLDRAIKVMDWKMPNNDWPTEGKAAYEYADAWAVTSYFYLDPDMSLDNLGIDELIDAQITNINTLFGDSHTPGLIRKIIQQSKARGLQLVVYEGGTHVTAPHDRDDLVKKLAQVNKDPRMKDVYTVMLQQWEGLYKEYGAKWVGVLNHYYDIGRYNKFGYWGLLQSTYQAPESAPKYQAIIDYVSVPKYQVAVDYVSVP